MSKDDHQARWDFLRSLWVYWLAVRGRRNELATSVMGAICSQADIKLGTPEQWKRSSAGFVADTNSLWLRLGDSEKEIEAEAALPATSKERSLRALFHQDGAIYRNINSPPKQGQTYLRQWYENALSIKRLVGTKYRRTLRLIDDTYRPKNAA